MEITEDKYIFWIIFSKINVFQFLKQPGKMLESKVERWKI